VAGAGASHDKPAFRAICGRRRGAAGEGWHDMIRF
jgi:hypothetical protein